MREKLVDLERVGDTVKTLPKGRERKRATAAGMRVIALEAVHAEAKNAQRRLAEVSVRSKVDATKARADLENCKARLSKVEHALKLVSATLNEARKQSVEAVKSPRTRHVS